MNGLEAIELMKQGKVIKYNNLLYRFQQDEVQVASELFQRDWKRSVSFDLNYTGYEECIEPKPLTGWERVGENESYYNISCNCYVEKLIEERCMEDKYYYEDANYFSTEEKAEEINFKQTLFRKLQRFSDENGGNEIDWNDAHCKYSIKYAYDDNNLFIGWNYDVKEVGVVYFVHEEIAKQAIELFRDDLIKYFTHDWGGENE